MARNRKTDTISVVVIGLGRFGSAVAESLVNLGQEVLAVDENRALVERWADDLTHVVQADTTDDQALRQLGVADFDRAVVAIGADIEASVLTVLALAEAGVPDIWAKAITRKHGADPRTRRRPPRRLPRVLHGRASRAHAHRRA